MPQPIKIAILLLAFLSYTESTLQAQWSVGVTIGGLAFHHEKASNPEFYPWKLDKKGIAIIFSGMNVSFSYRINDYLGVKAVQTLIWHDSGGKLTGISHIGLQIHDDIIGMDWEKHHLSMSIGPFWYYRKNWTRIAGYQNDPKFMTLSGDGHWERKFVWYGGFMDYSYVLDEKKDFTIDFLPGFPHVYAWTAGLNWK